MGTSSFSSPDCIYPADVHCKLIQLDRAEKGGQAIRTGFRISYDTQADSVEVCTGRDTAVGKSGGAKAGLAICITRIYNTHFYKELRLGLSSS